MSIQSIAHCVIAHLRPKRICGGESSSATSKSDGKPLQLTTLSSTTDLNLKSAHPVAGPNGKANPKNSALTTAFAKLLGKTKLSQHQLNKLLDVFVASSGIHRLDSGVRTNYLMSDFTRDPSASNFRSVDTTENEISSIRTRVLQMKDCSAKTDLLKQLDVFTGMLKRAEQALDKGLGSVTGPIVLRTADMPDHHKARYWLNVEALAHTRPRSEREQIEAQLAPPRTRKQSTAPSNTEARKRTCNSETVINWETRIIAMR